MNNKLILGLCICIATTAAHAQNEEDALRYSTSTLSGTARFTSMGGAFTALGGDLSAIGQNPASIGVYRRSEFTFTPGFYFQQTSAEFNNEQREENRLNLNIGNIGYLGNFYSGRHKWKDVSVAVGYNRTNSFSNEIGFEGISKGSSILDNYVNNLNQNGGTPEDDVYNSDPFGAGLAYNAFLINPSAEDSSVYNHVLQNSQDVLQSKQINRSGGMGEYFLGMGANYNDRLYFGGTIGLTTIRYREESTYKEIPDAEDATNDLTELRRYETLQTNGVGFVAKMGMIARVTNWLRLGTSIHTPTYYRMADNWSSQIDADYENGDQFREESPNGSFDYRLTTPAKASFGLGIVVGKKGIISGEYEYIDYSLAKLGTPNLSASEAYDFNLENENIKSLYQPAGNIKTGMEWRLDPFRLRAGFNYRQNAFRDEIDANNSSYTYTLGFGYREADYFIDLGYSLTQFDEDHYTYSNIEEPASVSTNAHYLLITVGFRY
jgi:hypothetical protein